MELIVPFRTITELIGRKDIGEEIGKSFTVREQEEMLLLMKEVLTDELVFVMSWKQMEAEQGRNEAMRKASGNEKIH